MPTGDVFVVELDGEHVASGFLRTNAQRERHVVSLNQLTHGSLADPHALRRQRTCHTTETYYYGQQSILLVRRSRYGIKR